MVGLGETSVELIETMKQVVDTGVSIFTIGQYLQPTGDHLPVERYVSDQEFEEYKCIGLELGFLVVSDGSPYPYKMKVRAPSFWHTGLLQDLLPGHQLADVVTIIGTTNIVFGEVDR